MKKTSVLVGAMVMVLAPIASAQVTYTVDVDMAGWAASSGPDSPANGSQTIVIGTPGGGGFFTVTAVEFIGLQWTAGGGGWFSELVLSVNDGAVTGSQAFWDAFPSSMNAGGESPVTNGAFPNPGAFGSGPFDVTTGSIVATAWNSWGGGGSQQINAGILRITYVPAPGAIALLGAAGLLGSRRRRA